MHTMRFDEIPDWTVNHNGDFSGDVTLYRDDQGQGTAELEVPFALLKGLVAEYIRRKAIAQLERATPDEVLGALAAAAPYVEGG